MSKKMSKAQAITLIDKNPIRDIECEKFESGYVVTFVIGKAKDFPNRTKKYISSMGPFIRMMRIKRGYSQKGFGRYSGFSPSTLKYIEEGKSEPVFGSVMNIFEALEVTMQDFINYVEKQK